MKKLLFFFMATALLAISSCRTQLADDGKHPILFFVVSGDNFSFSWSSINPEIFSGYVDGDTARYHGSEKNTIVLRHNPNGTIVTVTTTVIDGGGAQRVGCDILPLSGTYDFVEQTPSAIIGDVDPAPTTEYCLYGDEHNPLTGLVHTMKIEVHPGFFYLRGFGFDYTNRGHWSSTGKLYVE